MIRFSIIIPTRQRHETLPFAIRTALEQSFLDYEIIVCDNCSSFETFDVVKSFDSSKIKYVRSEVPLAMYENWELAVSQASGEYVILFGDDDGLMPHALKVLNDLLKKSLFKVIAWNRIHYHWPNLQPPSLADQLYIPLTEGSFLINGSWITKEIVEGRKPYDYLPMLYNAVIERSLLQELKTKTGCFFRSISPDIYSGFAFASLSHEYLYINTPMSINGGSLKSNGHSFFTKSNEGVAKDFKDLNEKSGLSFHPKAPYIKSIHSVIVDSYYRLNESLPLTKRKLKRELIFKKIIRGMRAGSIEEWNENVERVRVSLKDEPRIFKKLKSAGLLEPPLEFNEVNVLHIQKGVTKGNLNLNTAQFGIQNVLEAAFFCEKILSLEDRTFESYQPIQNLRQSLGATLKNRIRRILR